MPEEYPWELLPLLATAIEHKKRSLAHEELEKLLSVIGKDGTGSLALRKLRCAQVVSACLRGAQSGGAASDPLLKEHFQILAVVQETRSWTAIRQQMHRYIDRLLHYLRKANPSTMERLIRQLRRDLQTAAGQARSLAQHAQIFGVSEGHLSRSFRAITGRTFRRELRRIRIETAKRLLAETTWKLDAVVGQIGLRDTSQFIADFRADVGLTPGEYRIRNLGESRRFAQDPREAKVRKTASSGASSFSLIAPGRRWSVTSGHAQNALAFHQSASLRQ